MSLEALLDRRWRAVPPLTTALCLGLVALYGAMVAWEPSHLGRPWPQVLWWSRDGRTLLAFGARVGPLVQAGETWRLVTCAGLHHNLGHLALNALGLFAAGRLLEPIWGGSRLLAVAVAGALGASLLSQAAGVPRSVGASGVVFAWLGAGAGLGLVRWQELGPELRHLLVTVLGGLALANLLVGAVLPFVDSAAHLGGLLVGVALGALVPARPSHGGRVLDGLLALGAGGTLVWAGLAAVR